MILIDEHGNNLGEMTYPQAKKIAEQHRLDLITVSQNKVWKLADRGKLNYTKQKQERKNHQKAKGKESKTLKLSPNIGRHDLDTKSRRVTEWLDEGRLVQVEMAFKGRMITHKDIGEKILNDLIQQVADHGTPQGKPKLMGNVLRLSITPKKR